MRPPFSFCKKKMRRARWKRKTLFVLERDFRQKISVKALGAGTVLLYPMPLSTRRTAVHFQWVLDDTLCFSFRCRCSGA